MTIYKKSLEFFQPKEESEIPPTPCILQVPSMIDLENMVHMPTGIRVDQAARLKNMVKGVQREYKNMPDKTLSLVTTDAVTLPKAWVRFFDAIKTGDLNLSLTRYKEIPETDEILQALQTIHTKEYLTELLVYSASACSKNFVIINQDIIITSGTLEALVKDIATTFSYLKENDFSAKLIFSFGLPTHHAYANSGQGFCVLNKTLILLDHIARNVPFKIRFLIVGTDVNRDDGISLGLQNYYTKHNLCHVDLFDSRVYPHHDLNDIEEQFKAKGKILPNGVQRWGQDNNQYIAVDLKIITRKQNEFHPALAYALDRIKEELYRAQETQQKVFLMMPCGWDSHEDETAGCSKQVNEKPMTHEQAKASRFNNQDILHFHEEVFKLCQEYKELIGGIYWGLEGGYDPQMYRKQIPLLMQNIVDHLVTPSVKTKRPLEREVGVYGDVLDLDEMAEEDERKKRFKPS